MVAARGDCVRPRKVYGNVALADVVLPPTTNAPPGNERAAMVRASGDRDRPREISGDTRLPASVPAPTANDAPGNDRASMAGTGCDGDRSREIRRNVAMRTPAANASRRSERAAAIIPNRDRERLGKIFGDVGLAGAIPAPTAYAPALHQSARMSFAGPQTDDLRARRARIRVVVEPATASIRRIFAEAFVTGTARPTDAIALRLRRRHFEFI